MTAPGQQRTELVAGRGKCLMSVFLSSHHYRTLLDIVRITSSLRTKLPNRDVRKKRLNKNFKQISRDVSWFGGGTQMDVSLVHWFSDVLTNTQMSTAEL